MIEETVITIRDANPQLKARSLVYGYAKANAENTDFAMDDVKVVWFCKTLQNWKAMVATLAPDGGFFEVTYNGDKEETYLYAYKKIENVVFKDEDL